MPGPYFKGDESKCTQEDYLFKSLGKEPVASASLGQVYKGETWEGDVVAVKVQVSGRGKRCRLETKT